MDVDKEAVLELADFTSRELFRGGGGGGTRGGWRQHAQSLLADDVEEAWGAEQKPTAAAEHATCSDRHTAPIKFLWHLRIIYAGRGPRGRKGSILR